MITGINSQGTYVEKKESFTRFLGVTIDSDEDHGTITMTQTDLIDIIVMAMGLDNVIFKDTPAILCATLLKAADANKYNSVFNFVSVLRMLLCLQRYTHHYISFAIKQCIWYGFGPRNVSWRDYKACGTIHKGDWR